MPLKDLNAFYLRDVLYRGGGAAGEKKTL